ncbi:hypothetical protein Y032_1061g3515 [Ancylostoma ceylanicum]|uniref:Reverse transcriptase domain-containing protein n=1 Tax=Ancylostoma ceylanicum TaxID=53326 RepID=A0A016W6E1_9BILA|nr:hypothetical protein Y032_1061g3515 [Ancylostoma ceylanicum]
MGFTAEDITTMINSVLFCNVFRFENKLYEQKRGLAMGNRIAPLLAIMFLDHIEKSSLTSGILLYKRYIDDVFVIGTTEMDVDTTLDRLNAFDPKVSFTVERPDSDGYLPFLNTKIRVIQGQKEHLWHKKSASANILVHARSAHPHFIKANVVRNLMKTKNKLCMGTDQNVERTIARILDENGYNTGPTTTWFPYSTSDGIPMILPYVGERPARAVNQVVKRSGLPIRLVFRPPPTLKKILTSTRIYESKCPQPDCQYCTEEQICQLRDVQWNRDVLSTTVEGRNSSKSEVNYPDDVDDYEPQGLLRSTTTPASGSVEVHVVGRSTADSTTMDMKPERELDVLTTEQQSKARLHTYIAALMFSCIL